MGLFDKFIGKNEVLPYSYKPLSDYEAWIGILYACVSADGEVSDSEIDSLSRMLLFKKKFNGINIVPLYKNVMEAKQKIDGGQLVEVCSQFIEEDDKPTLFAMAVEIVLIDGLLQDEEKKIIEFIAEKLNIDSMLVEKIVEVMLIRNNGNLIFD